MDMYSFIIQVLIALPPIIIALITLYKVVLVKSDVKEVHLAINSRLDDWMKSNTAASIAIGRNQVHTELAIEAENAAKIATFPLPPPSVLT